MVNPLIGRLLNAYDHPYQESDLKSVFDTLTPKEVEDGFYALVGHVVDLNKKIAEQDKLIKSYQHIGQTYVIQTGDTMFGISKKLTGDGDRYTELLEHNPEITNKHKIYPLNVLRIPPTWLP